MINLCVDVVSAIWRILPDDLEQTVILPVPVKFAE
jgi:hypothetical protein